MQSQKWPCYSIKLAEHIEQKSISPKRVRYLTGPVPRDVQKEIILSWN